MPVHHPPAEGPVKAGEIVLLDYEVWTTAGERTDLVDTTRAEAAQSAGLKLPEGYHFGPKPHLVGGDYFPSGIENALAGASVGEELVKEFAPAEAFGERDPKLIELFSMHEIERLPEMRRDDAHLDVGTVLTIGGRRGRVVSLTAARVRVDFNPPIAGRKVRAKLTVTSRISSPVDLARAVVEMIYGHGEEFTIEAERDGLVSLTVPDRTKFDVAWLAQKPRLIQQLREHLHPTTIRIVEEHVTPPAKPAAAAPEAAAAPAAEAKPPARRGHEPSPPAGKS